MLSPNDVKLSKGQPVKPVAAHLAIVSPVSGKQVGTWTGATVQVKK